MEWDADQEPPKFIRDAIRRRQGFNSSSASGEKSTELSIGEFQGSIPAHVQKAIAREESEGQILQNQQSVLAKDIASQKISYKFAKRLLVPVNETKLRHQRLAKQIRSEFKVK